MNCKLSSEPILYVYAFNFATWIALTPQVILHKVCIQELSSSSNICKNITEYPNQQTEIQKESTYWQMLFFLTINIMSLFSILIIGPLTDIIGRKKGFLFVSFLMACMNGVMFLNIYYEDISPGYITFCAILSGLFGDLSGVILLCYSDMADITDSDKKTRTFKMGVLESCLFLGLGSGGITSGYLIQHYGFKSVPILNMVMAGILFLYIIAVLPAHRSKADHKSEIANGEEVELLSDSEKEVNDENDQGIERKDKSEEINLSLFNPWFHLKHVLIVFSSTPVSRIFLFVLFLGYFLAMFTITGDGYVLALYLKNAPFNVSPATLGILISVHGLVGFLGAILGGIASYCFKMRDDIILVFGLLGQFATFIMLGLARSLVLIVVSRITGLTHPIVSSTFRSYVTKICGITNKHGSVLSALECLDVLAGILSSFIVLNIYRATLTVYSGIVFFVLAGFSGIGVCLLIGVSIKTKPEKL